MSMAALPLLGKVVLVTGGAGGIGSAICRTLASQGATLIVGYHSSLAAATALLDEPPFQGRQHRTLAVNVKDSAQLEQAASEIAHGFGRLDMLVNCAGTTRFVPADDLYGLDDALIDDVLMTNVRGPIIVIRALRALLAKSDSALIVNISSIAAQTAMGSNIVYCASKAALDNLTKSLGRALAPAIRVISIAPGLVDTAFVKQMPQAWRDEQIAKTPLGHLTSPEQVALAVSAAATHLTFSTGTIFSVDGGRPLS